MWDHFFSHKNWPINFSMFITHIKFYMYYLQNKAIEVNWNINFLYLLARIFINQKIINFHNWNNQFS